MKLDSKNLSMCYDNNMNAMKRPFHIARALIFTASTCAVIVSGFFILRPLTYYEDAAGVAADAVDDSVKPAYRLSSAIANIESVPVIRMKMEGSTITVPDHEAGIYIPSGLKSALMVGHPNALKGLWNLQIDDEIDLNGTAYHVWHTEIIPAEDDIDIDKILSPEHIDLPEGDQILAIMTDAGKYDFFAGTFSHKLLVYASRPYPKIVIQINF